MAKLGIGKLKLNLSGQGLAYRWGDGEVHSVFNRKKGKADDDQYDVANGSDAYQDDYEPRNGDYDAGYDVPV